MQRRVKTQISFRQRPGLFILDQHPSQAARRLNRVTLARLCRKGATCVKESAEAMIEKVSLNCPIIMSTSREGLQSYYLQKIEEYEQRLREKEADVKRLEVQRNEWNGKGTFPLFNAIL